jgi:hypothetical protein
MTSEESIPEPPNVFIYNEDTKYDRRDKNVTHIKFDSSVKEIRDYEFEDCCLLVEIEFSEGLEKIGRGAFLKCKNLRHINKLPSTLKEIGEYTFGHCQSLVEVQLSEGLKRIGELAFYKCDRLKHINKLPSTLKEIGDEAFRYCYNLESIYFPERLQVIGKFAFAGCQKLTRIKIASARVVIKSGVFSYCVGMISVELPAGLQVIGEGWFAGCSSLTTVNVPSSVKEIQDDAFAECSSLVSIALPERMHSIGDRSFIRCKSLESIFGDVVDKLQHRFDALPVHRLCYYLSYYPLTKTTENLRQTMDADPSACTKVDSFGMTPVHILALSQTPSLSLFQELLKVNKLDIIQTRDKFGSTPLDYLCLKHTPDSSTVIQSLLQTTISQRIQWLGLARWKSDISAAMDEALAAEWPLKRPESRLLFFKLATYERLESLSLLESALWKVKVDRCKAEHDTAHECDEESQPKRSRLDKSHSDGVDRQSCRINSGAEVVISNVLPFLDKVCREECNVAD